MKPTHPSAWRMLSLLCWSAILVIVLWGAGCQKAPTPSGKASPAAKARASLAAGGQDVCGLRIRLSEATEGSASRVQPLPLASAVPLEPAQVRSVLARLPAMAGERADRKAFALRERSLPPPRTGETVKGTWPPPPVPDTPPEEKLEPLKVLRHAPEGAVPVVPALSVTFNQPMVPVTSHEELASKDVPVKLDPEPPGRWRWIGTRTLLFEPVNGFPKSTEYTVQVPAGTASASKSTLETAVQWTFRTPPLEMVSSFPTSGPQVCDPLLFVAFNQKIDPAAVIKTMQVRAGGSEVPVRLATEEEIKGDEAVSSMSQACEAGRWLALRATKPFSPDQSVTVRIGPGTPSSEGPLKTTTPFEFSFRTYGPMRVVDQNCLGENRACEPMSPLNVQFSNPIDEESFDPAMVKVSPAIPGMKVVPSGTSLSILGRTRGRTKYDVTLDASLPDRFDQTLGKAQTLTFTVGSASRNFSAPGGPFVVLDPSAPPAYSVYTTNEKELKVTLYAVTPADWSAFLRYMHRRHDKEPPPPPGRLVSTQTVTPDALVDQLVETRIDLKPALGEQGLGHVVVLVEPVHVPRESYPPSALVWCESTRIGLDAFVDSSHLLAWASLLADGTSLKDVQFSLLPASASGLTATSGDDGMARLDLPDGAQVRAPRDWEGGNLLVARRGDDVAMLPENTVGHGGGSWVKRSLSDTLAWYIFDDRKMYRPGEVVHVKGWMRVVRAGARGDVENPAPQVQEVRYTLNDSRGNKVLEGKARVNALSGFDFSVKLPATMNLGHAALSLSPSGPMVGVPGNGAGHAFQVQEFRRPEFEVKAGNEQEGPFLVGEKAEVAVKASYYAGGGLPNAPVQWRVTTSTASFVPPGRSDYSFGPYRPFWGDFFMMDEGSYRRSPRSYEDMDMPRPPGVPVGGSDARSLAGRTDANGKHRMRIDFLSVDPSLPATVTAQASVTDVNRQTWTSSTSLLVHPSQHYVGMRLSRPFVEAGQPVRVDVIVTDLDGKALVGRPVRFRAYREDWKLEKGRIKQVEVPLEETKLTSATEPITHTLQPSEGGSYRIVATVEDDKGRPNRSEMSFYVAGGKTIPSRDVKQQKVLLIPDKQQYQPGEQAQILVQAPFHPAQGLLTVRRADVVRTERFDLMTDSHTLKIPVEEAYLGGVTVQVDLLGSDARTREDGETDASLGRRAAFASGSLPLSVPPLSRKLQVELAPREKAVEPGGSTTVDVTVKDAGGNAVAGGEVAVVVVDEAILALTSYKLGDPLATFYPARGSVVHDHHLRASLLLANPLDLQAPSELQRQDAYADSVKGGAVPAYPGAPGAARPMPTAGAPPMAKSAARRESRDANVAAEGRGGGGGEAAPAIRVRSDFNPLALFAAAVPTDASGKAAVEVKVPDNLTRYRIMAVAVADGKQFGMADSALTARLPLMVRPSAPRFLNFGDRFEFPVVLQNQTDRPMEVDVAVRCTNARFTVDARADSRAVPFAGRRVSVPANDRVEVRFPAAAEEAGTARFQVGGVCGRWTDAAQVSLPVWTPATTEAFATYGQLDGKVAVQPVLPPGEVWPQFGGLEVTTSSTALQALTDAVLYLQAYPFECSEQLSSRLMSVAALKDVLAAFKAEGMPSKAAMVAAVDRDVERLRQRQNSSGGFGYWRPDDNDTWPYLTVHVMHALQRAKEKGFKVPGSMLEQGHRYLKEIERHIPSWYGRDCRRAIIAYALYVRHRLGDRDAARARALIAEGGLESLGLECIGWLLPVLSGEPQSKADVLQIRRFLASRVTETANEAHFVTSYGEGQYLLMASDRRADAVLLEAIIGDQPKSDLVPKLVNSLLEHRVKGRWSSTQESVFALLALDRYFHTYEKVTPDFVARIWLGKGFAGEHRFKGRTTERFHVDIPMAGLVGGVGSSTPRAGRTTNLALGKAGKGRMYYRIGMQYAPRGLQMGASDHGFTVERRYEAIDNKDDVKRDAEGVWHLKAGAPVRVRVTLVAPTRRYHVALVDPLPAGIEIVNPGLAVSGSIPADIQQMSSSSSVSASGWESYWRWAWMGSWYEHQNLRDERAEAFTALLWEGVYNYTYVARATTPGTFVVPPAKAEEMYHPETFGRSASDRVIVE